MQKLFIIVNYMLIKEICLRRKPLELKHTVISSTSNNLILIIVKPKHK